MTPDITKVRVIIPAQLQVLANTGAEVAIELAGQVTVTSVIRALEARYPMLCGAILDHVSGKRRPLLRFFACGGDVSYGTGDEPLPEAIRTGREPFIILGAIAGG